MGRLAERGSAIEASMTWWNHASRHTVLQFLLKAGARYWPRSANLIGDQWALGRDAHADALGRSWRAIATPDWARDLGVEGRLLVDTAALTDGPGPEYQRCDWALAAFSHLIASAEMRAEKARGPCHSYSTPIKQTSTDLFERAWVNRIFLFMRRSAARSLDMSEQSAFGPLPESVIELSHDIDAVRKTNAIRFKQTCFETLNTARGLAISDFAFARQAALRAGRFALTTPRYDLFDHLTAREEALGLRSVFYVYAGRTMRPRNRLIDPDYDISTHTLAKSLSELSRRGWQVGLHGSSVSWRDGDRLARERILLEKALGTSVTRTRQHWLRFSLRDTWAAQSSAGLSEDSTGGFNDRPGFRFGAALRFHPWDMTQGGALATRHTPLVLMDSHLYAYLRLSTEQRAEKIAAIFDEVRTVRGEASILWHQHTLAEDYGWSDGYEQLMSALTQV
jgi:hypothetical protein